MLVTIVVMSLTAGLTPAHAQDDPSEERLAVVNAGRGAFREVDDGYRLVLDDVTSRAVWFDDRPGHDAGSYAIDELEAAFFSDAEPPNAALEVFDGRAAGEVVVVEISNPRYQPGRARLVLDARVLTEDETATIGLRSHAERATGRVPRTFGSAALFIDDSAGPCLASFWTFAGAIDQMSGISCEEAQAVVAAASAQHPEDSESSGGVYRYDFAFYTETWHAEDLGDHSSFHRTDHDVGQSFFWLDCSRTVC